MGGISWIGVGVGIFGGVLVMAFLHYYLSPKLGYKWRWSEATTGWLKFWLVVFWIVYAGVVIAGGYIGGTYFPYGRN